MADIDILHPHSLPRDSTREAVERLAGKLVERFGVEYAWDGDALDFKRSGIDGRIAMLPGQLHVTANLGFLLSMMQEPIETEIRRVLQERF